MGDGVQVERKISFGEWLFGIQHNDGDIVWIKTLIEEALMIGFGVPETVEYFRACGADMDDPDFSYKKAWDAYSEYKSKSANMYKPTL